MLLALETATSTCGVALLRDGNVVAEAHLHRPRVHAERLTPLVEEVLAHGEADAGDLEAVAVSVGPGSYTGLRIGVSTAKGWALAAGADLVGVPTLEAYTAQLRPMVETDDVVCALLDARRDEVYAGAYRWGETGPVEHAATTALPVDELPEWVGPVAGRLWVVGDGVPKSRTVLADVAGAEDVVFVPDVPPSAATVGRCGRWRLDAEGPDEVATIEPLYVKDVHATPAPSPFA